MRFFLFSFTVFISHWFYSQGIQFQNLTFEEASTLALKSNKGLFVDVYIDQCAPCKYLENYVFVNPKLGQLINDNLIAIRINPANKTSQQFNLNYNITSFPTLLFFDPNGNPLNIIKGSKEADYLIGIVEEVIHPEQSELIIAQKKYKDGNKEKSFLQDYIQILKKRELPVSDIAKEYTSIYGVNSEDFSDLQILFYAQLLYTDPLMINLFGDEKNYLNCDQILVKKIIRQLVDLTIKNSIENRDYTIVENFQAFIFSAYKSVIDPLITEEKLSKHLRTKFEDQMFWGRGNAYIRTDLHL